MENKIIKAKEGKVFKRIADNKIYGNEVSLGYTYYINNKKLEEPYLETKDDFEEIDILVNKEEGLDNGI